MVTTTMLMMTMMMMTEEEDTDDDGEGIDNGARDMAVLLPPGLTRPVHSMARLHSRLTATHKKTLPDRNQSINHKVSE